MAMAIQKWVEEAKRRGLDTETSCPLVFDRYLDEASVQMFESLNVMKRNELKARNEVKWEIYTKKIHDRSTRIGRPLHEPYHPCCHALSKQIGQECAEYVRHLW